MRAHFPLAGLTLASALMLSAPAAAESWLMENVRVVDPAVDTVGEPTRLAVIDGWIVDAEELPDDARRINADGRFAIPGLAEMHAHVPPVEDRQRVDDVLTLFLAHGITTIRGMLGEPGHLALRAELARGDRLGPRLITSGPSLNGNSVPDARRARARVRRQAEAGYDFLKLHPGLMPDGFAAIDMAADGLGIPFAGHVSSGVGLERALDAGQATIDHLDGYAQVLVPEDHAARQRAPGLFGSNLGDALDFEEIPRWAERTRAAGVWNVPTQTLIENLAIGDADALAARPAMRFIPAATRARWLERVRQTQASGSAEHLARFVEARRALILALHRSGAGVLLGADAPQIMNVPGDAAHHELELYVAAGLTPAEALSTGTVNVARFLDQPALGCLRPGCVADLVVLNANPLDDISSVRRIHAVARAGEWHDRAALDRMLDAVARRANPDALAAPD